MTTPPDPYGSPTPPDPNQPTPGQPPAGPPPTGQPPAYGQPPGAPQYGQPPPPGQPYGQPPGYPTAGYGAPASPFGQPGGPQLAGWGARAVGFLIDYLGPALVASFVQYTISRPLGVLLALVALGWGIYNGYLQGESGQSYGKKTAGTRLLREQDGQVIGGGQGVGRFLLHILDALPCYLGFLWPLWDSKKQTFADKIIKTVVVKA